VELRGFVKFCGFWWFVVLCFGFFCVFVDECLCWYNMKLWWFLSFRGVVLFWNFGGFWCVWVCGILWWFCGGFVILIGLVYCAFGMV